MSTKNSEKYGGYLYATIYGGFRSSLTHQYRMIGKMMYEGFKKDPDQSMLGTKIVVAANKREPGASLDEGKRAMTFEVYKRLCEELYNRIDDDHSFAHALLTTEWNLMVRSENFVNKNKQPIHWRSDILIYYFGTSKGNQTGDRANDTWHVYPNPNNPKCFIFSSSG